MRRVLVLLGIIAVSWLTPSAVSAAPGCVPATRAKTAAGTWNVWTVPFPEDEERGRIEGYVVNPVNPQEQWVTNGRTILRTGDGGCTWKAIFTVRPESAGTRVISHMEGTKAGLLAAAADLAHGFRFEIINPRTPAAPQFIICDAGKDECETPTPPVGTAGQLLAFSPAPSDPSIVYATVNEGEGNYTLLKSLDGGRTWTPLVVTRSTVVGTGGVELPWNAPGAFWASEYIVNPGDPEDVWAWAWPSGRFYHSEDGGNTWTEFANSGLRNFYEAAAYFDGGRTELTAFEYNGSTLTGMMARSADAADTWGRYGAPFFVHSAAYGRSPDEILVATSQQFRDEPPPALWYLNVTGGWENSFNIVWNRVTPPVESETFSDVHYADVDRPSFWVAADDEIARLTLKR